MGNNVSAVIEPIRDKEFVITPYIKDLLDSAKTYMGAGYPVNFCGPTGTGKTSLAMYLAAELKRPVIMLHGDDEFATSDLVGAEHGFRSKRVVDNFVHHVLKTEERVDKQWVDKRLSLACKHGLTLLYDEFTRSRPEANNVLLSVLEEKMLDLPGQTEGDVYLKVHPEFRAIFTSNPEEYAGIHRAQDALLDRMITIELGHLNAQTEVEITQKRSGVALADAQKIVSIVRDFREKREHKNAPTLRESIKIAKVTRLLKMRPSKTNDKFKKICFDILTSEIHVFKLNGEPKSETFKFIEELIDQHC